MLTFRPCPTAGPAGFLVAVLLLSGPAVLPGEQPTTQPATKPTRERTDPIGHIYRAALGRAPKPDERKAGVKTAGGKGMEALLISLLTGEEYRKRGRSDAEYVQDVFRAALGRDPTDEERKAMLETDGSYGRLMPLMIVLSTTEYQRVRQDRQAAIKAGDVKPTKPKPEAKPSPKSEPKRPTADKRPTTQPADRKPDRKSDTTRQPTTRPANKAKPPAEAPREAARPEPVSAEQVQAARAALRTAERDLMKLVRDRKVSLDSPRLVAARDAYFRARTDYWSLKSRRDQTGASDEKSEDKDE
jgi:hypothetical protein